METFRTTTLAGKQASLPPEEEKALFEAGLCYLANGAPEAAYACFGRLGGGKVPVLFNRALCCFRAGWEEECYRLLGEAEGMLPMGRLQAEMLPARLAQQEYAGDLHLCPMPAAAPQEWMRVQVLRLKAEAAFRLHLYSEVKAIAAQLQKPYRHIEELINQIRHETE